MPPIQRKRGLPAKVWKVTKQTDARGNELKIAVEDDAYDVTVWVYPQRSAKGEVPGQLSINVVRLGIPAVYDDLDLWTRVEFMGKQWDVVTPPSYHHGNRHTRHWTLDVRERP
jgi:hypothetical protein